MALAAIVATPTTEDAELATTRTPRLESFVLCRAFDSRFTALSCMRLLEHLKNAPHMKWSVTAKELSKQCKPFKLVAANPRDVTETWKPGSNRPFCQ
eukprot:1410953-Amphidinium_carterae.1